MIKSRRGGHHVCSGVLAVVVLSEHREQRNGLGQEALQQHFEQHVPEFSLTALFVTWVLVTTGLVGGYSSEQVHLLININTET